MIILNPAQVSKMPRAQRRALAAYFKAMNIKVMQPVTAKWAQPYTIPTR